MDYIEKDKMRGWLSDYITDRIRSIQVEGGDHKSRKSFIEWARSLDKKEADFVVNMEFFPEYCYDERTDIPLEEATSFGEALISKILNTWYIGHKLMIINISYY